VWKITVPNQASGARGSSVSPDDELDEAQRLEVLDRAECIELLTRHAFLGRLGLVVDGRPLIFPVNYMADRDAVVFCTASGTKLDNLAGGAPVVFEVDDHVPLRHSGWSVMVQGHADVITDPTELERLRRGPLRPWARGARATWVRIPLEEISGRRIPEL
jgi:nitroimidazol reductase NimA-like FMN-containing flavoprotein (pyridoxamine 5'-phosphate oxidase superfamily)